MREDIFISNPEELEKLKKSISKAGAEKLHVLADFDKTLTKAFVDGESTPSIISVLRDGNYLTSDYAEKANNLYAKYHPIEINPQIPLEEKKKAMEEWWMIHFDLLIKSGLNKKDLEKIAESGKVRLKDGALEFIEFLNSRNVPLVIMSGSGVGGDFIPMLFMKEGKSYENIHIISNLYEWDEKGNAVAVKKPIIHVMNKDETSIQDFPAFDAIKDRKNVMLLGDILADIGMVEGFDYECLIKIGFLNENIEENLEQYKKSYDVLVLNDSSMHFVNALLKEMLI